MKRLEPFGVALSGTNLIEASAGTGKTYAITNLYLRLLLERDWEVGEILVVTYTRAATSELRDRIRARLADLLRILSALETKESATSSVLKAADPLLVDWAGRRYAAGHGFQDCRKLVQALRAFDQAAIFTIHSFCQRVLQDSAFESGVPFDTEFVTDQKALVRQIGEDFWAHKMYGANTDWVRYVRGAKPALKAEHFVALAHRAINTVPLPVLPEWGDGLSREQGALLKEWKRCQELAREVWQRDEHAIVELLSTSPALNRRSYNPETIDIKWRPAMEGLLEPRSVGIPGAFEEHFKKFTPAGLAKGTKKKHVPPEHSFFLACEALLDASGGLATAKLALERELIDYAREQLRIRKKALGLQSFDDLLHNLAEALAGAGGAGLAKTIRTRFPGALIDEFQDTDPVQYKVFSDVYQGAAASVALFLIGDPKQAIYAFRGADVFAYMAARQDAAERCHTLDTNWRSDPDMVRGVNALFEGAHCPFVFEEIGFHPVQFAPTATNGRGGRLVDSAALELVWVGRDETGAKPRKYKAGAARELVEKGVVSDITRLLAPGALLKGEQVVPGDIAVLVKTNRQATSLQAALREFGVPSVIDGESSVFDTEEAEELTQLLAAVVEPTNTRFVVAALTTSLLGKTGNEVSALRADEARFDEWLQKFRSWHQTWQERGFIQAYRQLLGEEGVPRGVLSREGGGRRLTNFYHLGELLETQSVAGKLGPQALMVWLERMRADGSARSDSVGDTSQVRLETDSDAVQLVTVHKSKGLEYPIVFCPFLWGAVDFHKSDNGRVCFHDPADNNRYKLDIGSSDQEEHKAQALLELHAESLRLLYVAVTRAKHHCCVHWGAFERADASALGYLLHQPDSHCQGVEGLNALKEHIKKLTDNELREDLRSLARSSEGAIGVRDHEALEPIPYLPPVQETVSLRARKAERTLGTTGRLSSFTSLTATETRAEPEARDVDRLNSNLLGEQAAGSGATPASKTVESATDSSPVTLADFPRGAQVGVMLHDIFENASFPGATTESLEPCVDSALGRFGGDVAHRDSLLSAVAEILHTPLVSKRVPGAAGASSFCLADVGEEQRIDEMEFLFPVQRNGTALRASALGETLAGYEHPPWSVGYPALVSSLDFAPLSGFLRGFVDLIFCHAGKWYVVDYKSNFLGPTALDYQGEALNVAMEKGHYYLQALIYVVALHRYLQLRVTGYDYDEHMGGIFYLFLRGMAPGNSPGSGVFGDRPPRQLVEALSDRFRRVGAVERHSA